MEERSTNISRLYNTEIGLNALFAVMKIPAQLSPTWKQSSWEKKWMWRGEDERKARRREKKQEANVKKKEKKKTRENKR